MFQVYPYNVGDYLDVQKASHRGVRLRHPIFIDLGHGVGFYSSFFPFNGSRSSILRSRYNPRIDSYEELVSVKVDIVKAINFHENSNYTLHSDLPPIIYDDAPRQKIYLPGALAIAELTRWPIIGPHCEPMNAPDCQYCSNRNSCRYAFKPGERAAS